MASEIRFSLLVYAGREILTCFILQTLSGNTMLIDSTFRITSENALNADTILSKEVLKTPYLNIIKNFQFYLNCFNYQFWLLVKPNQRNECHQYKNMNFFKKLN